MTPPEKPKAKAARAKARVKAKPAPEPAEAEIPEEYAPVGEQQLPDEAETDGSTDAEADDPSGDEPQ